MSFEIFGLLSTNPISKIVEVPAGMTLKLSTFNLGATDKIYLVNIDLQPVPATIEKSLCNPRVTEHPPVELAEYYINCCARALDACHNVELWSVPGKYKFIVDPITALGNFRLIGDYIKNSDLVGAQL